jgi:hypothetical protein
MDKDQVQKVEVDVDEVENEINLGEALMEDPRSMFYAGAHESMNDSVSCRYRTGIALLLPSDRLFACPSVVHQDKVEKGEEGLEEENEGELGQALNEDAYSLLNTGANEWMNDAVS